MIKKKVVTLTLLTTVGITNTPALATENKVEEQNKDNNQILEKEEFKELTEEDKESLNLKSKVLSKGKVKNVSSNLRIREKPSTDSAVKGTLKNNQSFDIKSKEGLWYKINVNGITGYVHGDYVSIIESDTSNNNSNNNNNSNSNNSSLIMGQVINVSSSLRIRSSANTSSSILGYLYPNEKIEILGESNGWYKIKKNSIIGYVSGNYIKKLSSNSNTEKPITPPIETPTETPNENINGLKLYESSKNAMVYNVSSNLRVRSEANTSSSVIGYLLPNEKVSLLGEKGEFYYLQIGTKKGFTHKNYIKIINNENNTGNGNDSNLGASKENYNKVLNVMKSQIGSPYVFGGNGEIITDSLLNSLKAKYPTTNYSVPSEYINKNYRAFDCSGLMRWSFNEIGIKLGRSTYDQIKNGIEVSLDSLKEGDLLFYSDLNHVGMYVGNGKWLESPRTGEKVRISNVPWNKIGRARRVLN